MSHLKRIKRISISSGIYAGTGFFQQGASFFLLPLLTRFLTPFQFGILATFQVIYAFGQTFIDQGASVAVSREYFDMDTDDFGKYVFNTIIIKLIFLFILSCFLLLCRNLLFEKKDFPFWLLLGIPWIAFMTAFITTLSRLWIVQKKAHFYSLFELGRAVVNVILSIFFVSILLMNWKGRILGIAITETLFMCFCVGFLIKENLWNINFNLTYIKEILKFGVPVFIFGAGQWIMNLTDRLFINAMAGLSETGIYSMGYSVASIIEVIAAGVGLTVMPLFYEKLKNPTSEEKKTMVKYIYLYLTILLFITVFWILFSPYFLQIFVDKKYFSAASFIPLISWTYFINGIYRILSIYISYSKRTYLFLYPVITGALINIILNYILIRQNGTIGAAQATLISFCIKVLITWFIVQKIYPMPWIRFYKKPAA